VLEELVRGVMQYSDIAGASYPRQANASGVERCGQTCAGARRGGARRGGARVLRGLML
jgi:hypothetical protein